MIRSVKILSAVTLMLLPMVVFAEKKKDSGPEASLVYCLPSTVVTLEVEAVQEKFYAGPYAKYAEKYLGMKVRQKDETTYQLARIKMEPFVEADQSERFNISVTDGIIDASFLKLSSAGLVSFADAAVGVATKWHFPIQTTGDFSDKGVSSNLTSEATVLYKNTKKETAYNKVSVQQNMIVAKSLEKRAAETADMILDIRKQRLQIVTGDTDATYSGEAMAAAIDELTRLEKEYLILFTGYSESQAQKMNFEVIPDAKRENQKYIAFRLSDTAGLVPADNLSGKPVVIEFVPQEIDPLPDNSAEAPKKSSKKVSEVLAYYRTPAVCKVKLTDGVDILLQSRMPVYQLGVVNTLPVNVILK